MFLREIWRRITTSRGTREREAAAQYDRVQREGALRDDFARRTHALEAQIARAHAENCRLRAENRALLNSVLGIAGIPPVIVADPAAAFIEGASDVKVFSLDGASSVGARHVVPARPAGRPGADAWRDTAHTATPSHGGHSEERSDEESLFVSPGRFGAKPKRDPSGESGPQDDGVIRGGASENGATSPGKNLESHGSATTSTSAQHGSSALRQKSARRARAVSDPLAIAPIRRRSWHQIYRMLEFESSRRKDQDS